MQKKLAELLYENRKFSIKSEKAAEELAAKLISNGVLVIPCEVRSTIYINWPTRSKEKKLYLPATVVGFDLTGDGLICKYAIKEIVRTINTSCFGTTVFLEKPQEN